MGKPRKENNMADILNKVIAIKAKEESKTKNGTNTIVRLTDQNGVKFCFFKKKSDGEFTSVASQFKNMGLDEDSVVRIGYVEEQYNDVKGIARTTLKIINFQETNEVPDMGTQTHHEPKYEPTREPTSRNYNEENVGKCQSLFLAAYIQSGKSIQDTKLQVVPARQLAELVVYGTQKTKAVPEGETVTTDDFNGADSLNVSDIPF